MIRNACKGIAALLLICSPAAARGHNFGLGVIVGEPTALSAKLWISPTTALDFGVGWGWGYDGWRRYGVSYSDDRCYDNGFYNRNRNYCDNIAYDYDGRYGRYDARGLHLHMDYLFHNFNLIRSTERFPLYYGPGLSYNYWYRGDTQLGIRGVVGLAWMPRATPLDLFIELAPVLQLFPGTWLDVNAGLGIRFYF